MDEPNSTVATKAAEATPVVVSGAMEAFNELINGDISAGTMALLLKVIVPATTAILLLIVTYFAARLVSRWIANFICNRVDQTLGRFAGKVAFYAIMTLVGMSILQSYKFDVTSFAAVIAAAGFAIGLAFQGTLSNFSSGILLLVFRPFKVGDMINAAGVMGTVNEIDLFTTTLDTPDNRRLIVPNSSIAGATIENVTYHKHRRVDVAVGVAYAANIEVTRQVLTACAESLGDKVVSGEGRGYQILLTNLGAHAVEWTVRVWANSADFFVVKEALTSEIKRQLDAHGLEIPFPQMQLHVKHNEHRVEDSSGLETILPTPRLSSLERDHVERETTRANRVRPRQRGDSI